MKAKYKHYGNECIIYDQVICEDNIVVTVRSYDCSWSTAETDVRTKVCPTDSEAKQMFFNFCKKCEKERYECMYKECHDEDDFPNCSISGCEAADAVCHLTCPYSKELADLKRDAIARLKEKGIDVYIYAMEYDEDGTPYFAFTFDKDKVAEAKEAWEEGSIIKGCYDEYVYGDFYEYELHDMCQTITNRYERKKKE